MQRTQPKAADARTVWTDLAFGTEMATRSARGQMWEEDAQALWQEVDMLFAAWPPALEKGPALGTAIEEEKRRKWRCCCQ